MKDVKLFKRFKATKVLTMCLVALFAIGLTEEKKDKPKIIIKAGPVVIIQPTQK